MNHGPRTRPVVALTFDDGWAPERCLSIGQELRAEGVPATFFLNGKYAREAPGVFRWLAARGFTFGNHTFSHTDQTTLPESGVIADLDNARRVIESVIGMPSLRAFRPPFGRTTPAVLEAARTAGYAVALTWDVDSRDWASGTVDGVVRLATAGVNGSVVLMHCGSEVTPLALPRIIDSYRARGFGFVSVAELLSLAAPKVPVWTPDPGAIDPWPASALPLPCPCWRPSLAIAADGDTHVAFESPAGISYASDASGAWSSDVVEKTTDASVPVDPALALDEAGGIHLAWERMTPGVTTLMYATKRPGGEWSAASAVLELSGNPTTIGLAVDHTGHAYVAWRRTGPFPAGVLVTTNASGSWRTTAVPGSLATDHNPTVAVDAAGALHVAWRSDDGHVRYATNGSGPWVTTDVAKGHWDGQVAVAADGRVRLALADMRDPRIRLVTLGDDGAWHWTTVASSGDGPGLAIAPDGSVRVAFWRVDPASGTSEVLIAAR